MPQLTHSDNHTGSERSDAAPPDAPGADSTRAGVTTDLDELRLAAEEAEAEAVAAEAVAAAAQARARATRLRQRAVAAAHSAARDGDGDDTVAAVGATTSNPAAAVPHPPPDTTAAGSGAAAVAPDTAGSHTTVEPETAPAPASTPASAATATPATPTPAATEAPDADAGPTRRSPRLPSAKTLIGAIAIAVIAVSVTVSGLLVHHHRETVQADQRRAEFTEAARQGVVALTSLDFSRAEQDVQRVLEHSTGAFRDDFESRAQDFTSVIEQSQVATAGTVNSAAVESMTEDSAVVLVAATSEVTNSAGAQEEPRAWRLSVTVTREGDTIKMSKVEFVP